MPKPKENKSLITIKAKKKKPVAKATKYDPAMLQVVEKHVFNTGKMDGVWDNLDISKATFFRWLRDKRDLKEVVSRAQAERTRLVQHEFNGEMKEAVDSLFNLMRGYFKSEKKTYVTASRNDQVDEHGGVVKVGEEIYRTVDIRHEIVEKWYPADLRAIEKVLGREPLMEILFMDQLTQYLPKVDEELYQQLFGIGDTGWDMPKFTGMSILNPQVDLIKLRFMEIVIQNRFDRGSLSMDKWIEYNAKLKQLQGQISDRIETRAQRLMNGRSYSEIVEQYVERWKKMLSVLRFALEEELPQTKKNALMIEKIMVSVVDTMNERGKSDADLQPLKS